MHVEPGTGNRAHDSSNIPSRTKTEVVENTEAVNGRYDPEKRGPSERAVSMKVVPSANLRLFDPAPSGRIKTVSAPIR